MAAEPNAEESAATVKGVDDAKFNEIASRSFFGRYLGYLWLSGPGWLQSAITLGGGSLSGSLYLGVLAGFGLMWLQPLAMIIGVIMLSAIAYVTVSTGKRPFAAINEHINPTLGWSWALASMMANLVWCMPQFALGEAAIRQNLFPQLFDGTMLDPFEAKLYVVLGLFAIGTITVWFYDSGGWGVKLFEGLLKALVGIVVISFFGVVAVMTAKGVIDWNAIGKGFIPDFSLLNKPSASYAELLKEAGDSSKFWTEYIVMEQKNVILTAAATAVGINMTFLLPYSLLRKNWGAKHRELAVFDLSLGLFIPFLLATSCVVIASAQQFHAKLNVEQEEGQLINAGPKLEKSFNGLLDKQIENNYAKQGEEKETEFKAMVDDHQRRMEYQQLMKDAINLRHQGEKAAEAAEEEIKQLQESDPLFATSELQKERDAVPTPDRELAVMLVRRDAFQLADSLQTLTGKGIAQYVFGVGVLGMAISTIIILMLINGFVVCEISGAPGNRALHRVGALMAGLVGASGPFVWSEASLWLAVPTSKFGIVLLPIAYLAFFLMINSRSLMGTHMLGPIKRFLFNIVLLACLGLATFGSYTSVATWATTPDKQNITYVLLGIFVLLLIIGQFNKSKPSAEE